MTIIGSPVKYTFKQLFKRMCMYFIKKLFLKKRISFATFKEDILNTLSKKYLNTNTSNA